MSPYASEQVHKSLSFPTYTELDGDRNHAESSMSEDLFIEVIRRRAFLEKNLRVAGPTSHRRRPDIEVHVERQPGFERGSELVGKIQSAFDHH